MTTKNDYSSLKKEISADNEYTYIHDTSFDCNNWMICIKSDNIKQKVIRFDKVTLQNVTISIERNAHIYVDNCKLTNVKFIYNRDNIVVHLTSHASVLTQCYISSICSSIFSRVNTHSTKIDNSLILLVKELNICTSKCNSTIFKWCHFNDCTNNNFTKCEFVSSECFTARTECSKFNKCSYLESHCFYLHCPETGSYIAYKKAKLSTAIHDDCLVKLFIPEDALRSSATNMKCRASKAQVLDITDFSETQHYKRAISSYDYNFIYKVGETIEVTDFDKDRWNVCSAGIHHFLSKQEAIDYQL